MSALQDRRTNGGIKVSFSHLLSLIHYFILDWNFGTVKSKITCCLTNKNLSASFMKNNTIKHAALFKFESQGKSILRSFMLILDRCI